MFEFNGLVQALRWPQPRAHRPRVFLYSGAVVRCVCAQLLAAGLSIAVLRSSIACEIASQTANAPWNWAGSTSDALLKRVANETRNWASSARGNGTLTSSGPRILSRLLPTKWERSTDGAGVAVGAGGGVYFRFFGLADHACGAVIARAAIATR